MDRPSPDFLRAVFSYDEASGVLRWKENRGSRAKAGAVAGSQAKRGHLVVRVDQNLMMVHQVVWAMHTNEWPVGLIRHVNGDFSDNRIANLEVVSKGDLQDAYRSATITAENVHSTFRYRAGRLYWRESLSGKSRVAGREAGGVNTDGYVKVEAGGKAHSVHRIVWLMHHGEWPSGEIDHINGNRADNRIGNLRDVAHRTNSENRRKPMRGTATGYLGVYTHQSGRFRARIRVDGKSKSLGLHDTPELAHAAYVAAKRLLHAGNTL